MKGSPSGSWQEFSPLGGGGSHTRSAAWSRLIRAQSTAIHGRSQSLSSSSSTSSSGAGMFLESPPRISSTSNFETCGFKPLYQDMEMSAGGFSITTEGCHRKAALDFVLELAGSKPNCDSAEFMYPDPFVCADEVPVPMFAVDRDMRCTLWNQRMTELSKWKESEVVTSDQFPSSVFSVPRSKASQNNSSEDIFKAALYGRAISGVSLILNRKDGESLDVSLFTNVRNDAVGTVTGVLCVVMPGHVAEPAGKFLDGISESVFTLNSPQNSSKDSEADVPDWKCSVPPLLQLESNMKDYRSYSSASTSESTGRPRALLIDAMSASRSVLASQLERCGMEAVCATSVYEATWRFEQCLTNLEEGPPFSVVFGDLQAIKKNCYAPVKEIRRLEELYTKQKSPLKSIIIAVASMNRWDLAGMDDVMHQGMVSGVDAIIPQNIKMQQLRSTLKKLGVRSKYLEVPASLPRALSGLLHNPLNLSR